MLLDDPQYILYFVNVVLGVLKSCYVYNQIVKGH